MDEADDLDREYAEHIAAGRCPDCAMGLYPYYGGAPGRDGIRVLEHDIEFTDARSGRKLVVKAGPVLAQGEPAPRETWPSNFTEDPECPGLGTWRCPCGGDSSTTEEEVSDV